MPNSINRIQKLRSQKVAMNRKIVLTNCYGRFRALRRLEASMESDLTSIIRSRNDCGGEEFVREQRCAIWPNGYEPSLLGTA